MSNEFNIKNIAKLASINLSEEEQDSLSNDLSIILEHVNALSDLKLNSQQQEIFIHPLEKETTKEVESLTTLKAKLKTEYFVLYNSKNLTKKSTPIKLLLKNKVKPSLLYTRLLMFNDPHKIETTLIFNRFSPSGNKGP